ncbi:MAG: 3-methyladenine DNA glycosylase [Helicobacter sp.]|uniref:3-methyladenine DNA glycosylase n=1 Tax=Helicobacter sp. TaxID=218 RepID=UPI002A81FA60|nr:3-methyladenine DNA glycosylase [Helicobacter sp.]MDY4426586.1 3-methyladenine DNA glycosylase [Helicobacter sp.]
MQIQNSFDLFCFLKNLGYLKNPPHNLWWPNAGNFEVIIGAILVQNTRWESAFRAINRLRTKNLLSLEALAKIPLATLQNLMNDVGFFRQKSQRIIYLCQNILAEFGSFESFCENVSRQWLLSQKGIGNETCDAILCYGALRAEMVADQYTYKLLKSYGYELEDYDDIKEWLVSGIMENYKEVCKIYEYQIPLNVLYARFHGKIVEYCKEHKSK